MTVRGVARLLGVTPMTVSHRTGGRDGLLAWVLAAAHIGFEPPRLEAAGPEELAEAVASYADAARCHPQAVAALFARPDLMPPSLASLTAALRLRIAASDPAGADRGVALLIDYAHGHLLAASYRSTLAMEEDFRSNLRRLAQWLLEENH